MILLALLGYIYQLERAWVILLPLLVLFVVSMVLYYGFYRCPDCGAHIRRFSSKFCDQCGAALMEQ